MTNDWYPGSRRYRFIGGPWDGTKERIQGKPAHLIVAIPQKFHWDEREITPSYPPPPPKFTYELRVFLPFEDKPVFVYCDPALHDNDVKVQRVVQSIVHDRTMNAIRRWARNRKLRCRPFIVKHFPWPLPANR